MQDEIAHQTELLCPNCGGQGAYSPTHRALECQSCGTVQDLSTDSDAAAQEEFAFDPDVPRREVMTLADDQAHQCQTCGGEVIFVGPALSERCPYCDGPVVMGRKDAGFATMALIPFKVEAATAQSNVLAWARKRIAAPGDLANVLAQGRVAGLYAPFWTFDSDEAIDYWATYTTGSGKNRRRRKISGSLKTWFDDMLVPASPHVTPLIRDGILHDFDPEMLRPYGPGYLAGFAAERHHMSVADGLEAAWPDKRLLIKNRIQDHEHSRHLQDIQFKTDTSGIHYRRILLPVWILHYTYEGKAKKVVVSGIDGRTYGERPFSMWKLAGYAGALSLATILFGWFWGASGML